MEMCYDGALVMPSNYVVMDEEEMTYVEGGVSIQVKRDYLKRVYAQVLRKIILQRLD